MARGLYLLVFIMFFAPQNGHGQGQSDNWFDQGNQLYKNELSLPHQSHLVIFYSFFSQTFLVIFRLI